MTINPFGAHLPLAGSASFGASAATSAVGATSGGITVPTSSSPGQPFRSYGSLQQTQQGGSDGDSMLASLISGASSNDADDA
jgi:hypothetical protein